MSTPISQTPCEEAFSGGNGTKTNFLACYSGTEAVLDTLLDEVCGARARRNENFDTISAASSGGGIMPGGGSLFSRALLLTPVLCGDGIFEGGQGTYGLKLNRLRMADDPFEAFRQLTGLGDGPAPAPEQPKTEPIPVYCCSDRGESQETIDSSYKDGKYYLDDTSVKNFVGRCREQRRILAGEDPVSRVWCVVYSDHKYVSTHSDVLEIEVTPREGGFRVCYTSLTLRNQIQVSPGGKRTQEGYGVEFRDFIGDDPRYKFWTDSKILKILMLPCDIQETVRAFYLSGKTRLLKVIKNGISDYLINVKELSLCVIYDILLFNCNFFCELVVVIMLRLTNPLPDVPGTASSIFPFLQEMRRPRWELSEPLLMCMRTYRSISQTVGDSKLPIGQQLGRALDLETGDRKGETAGNKESKITLEGLYAHLSQYLKIDAMAERLAVESAKRGEGADGLRGGLRAEEPAAICPVSEVAVP